MITEIGGLVGKLTAKPQTQSHVRPWSKWILLNTRTPLNFEIHPSETWRDNLSTMAQQGDECHERSWVIVMVREVRESFSSWLRWILNEC
jgi:hypothetical protein